MRPRLPNESAWRLRDTKVILLSVDRQRQSIRMKLTNTTWGGGLLRVVKGKRFYGQPSLGEGQTQCLVVESTETKRDELTSFQSCCIMLTINRHQPGDGLSVKIMVYSFRQYKANQIRFTINMFYILKLKGDAGWREKICGYCLAMILTHQVLENLIFLRFQTSLSLNPVWILSHLFPLNV